MVNAIFNRCHNDKALEKLLSSAREILEDEGKEDILEAYAELFPLAEAYSQLAPNPEVLSLIASGESERVEFKEGAIRNPYTGKRDDKMRDNILKAVAAFMNSPTGGTLLIGVHDNGSITGVDVEYPIANKKKANWDGYQLFLADVLNNNLDIPIPFKFYTISRQPIQIQGKDKDICRIQVRHANQPVYVNKKLYVRSKSQSKELQGPDLMAYVQTTWTK